MISLLWTAQTGEAFSWAEQVGRHLDDLPDLEIGDERTPARGVVGTSGRGKRNGIPSHPVL